MQKGRPVRDASHSGSLKPDWKMVKFGDIAQNVAVRVDPADAKTDVYVGLEHLDPSTIHLRQWGHPSDVTGQKLTFKKGDVIFGRRRAYQRKLAVAEFDGICSAHAMVVRAKPKLILPEFLPFFLQSDMFMERAIEISVGSLSPTINWKTLREQEFPLPPLAEQQRIAEILWAADEAKESHYKLLEDQIIFRKTYQRESLSFSSFGSSSQIPTDWKFAKVGEVCQILNNLRKPISKAERTKIQGQYPYYGPTGKLDSLNEYRIEGEYVLIGEDGDHFTKFNDWAMTQLVSGRFNVNNHAHILRGTEKCLTKYIYYYFKHRDIGPYLSKQGATRLKLNKGVLETIPILLPSMDQQEKLCQRYAAIDTTIEACRHHLESSKIQIGALTRALIEGTHV
ncbi:restriction endonuclease subunit S [Megalodesulfovibrio paquesii]